jgi:hypothetical protein
MSRRRWQLLITLFDMPSAAALADVLMAEGIDVRVVSEAHLFGQAAPCRVFVADEQLRQANWTLSQRQFTEEELAQMSNAAAAETAVQTPEPAGAAGCKGPVP